MNDDKLMIVIKRSWMKEACMFDCLTMKMLNSHFANMRKGKIHKRMV